MGIRIIIIGGGPGGYAAAIKAAQLGADAVLVQDGKIGGTCLNEGCIPTKTLLHIGDFYRRASRGMPGVNVTGVSLDWPKAQSHKDDVIEQLTGGVGALLRHNGVTVYKGRASLLSGTTVKVGDTVMEGDAVILASGSVSAAPDIPGADLPGVLDSAGALSLTEVPESIVIAGGGVVGVELAALYGSIGVKVTIIELMPQLLPSFDEEIAAILHTALAEDGADIFTEAQITDICQSSGGLTVCFKQNGESRTVDARNAVIAIGRKPNTAEMGLETVGAAMTRGAVVTDGYFRTNVPGLYAVGDCNGRIMLAHAAIAQGIAAVEHICGQQPRYNENAVPGCVYATPELAAVGMTEKQAKNAGIAYSVGRFSLAGNGRAVIGGSGGLVKIIADSKLGEILGVHMIGPNVTEMIAEAALCIGMEGTVEDIANAVHAHPTVSEAVGEAAMSVFGKTIHGL